MKMLRYSLARGLIRLGLIIMPASAYKTRLQAVLWDLWVETTTRTSGDTSKHRRHTTKYEDLCQ